VKLVIEVRNKSTQYLIKNLQQSQVVGTSKYYNKIIIVIDALQSKRPIVKTSRVKSSPY